MILHIKYDQVWPTGFRDIQVQKCEIFLLDQAFMPVLVSSNVDDDSIKNEWASMETPFSH